MDISRRIRNFNPAEKKNFLPENPENTSVRTQKRKRNKPQEVILEPEFFGLKYIDYPQVSPKLWNFLVSLTKDIFKTLVTITQHLKIEMPGDEAEHIFFRKLPQALHAIVCQLASW